MLMARPRPEDEFRAGSFQGQAQQLPSFSHFLSGVQREEELPLHSRSGSLPAHGTETSFRRDIFGASGGYQAPGSPDIPGNSSSQQREQYPNGRSTLMAQDTEWASQTDEHTINRLPRPHSYHPHSGVILSRKSPAIMSAQDENALNNNPGNEAITEGKGFSYLYDVGAVSSNAVNSAAVNSKWGTTKAGKPRKRLGQACNTCREKKIRCDPQVPKCTQCQKYGRDCKFESGSRGSQKGSSSSARASPTTPDLNKDDARDRHGSSVSADTLSEQLYSRGNSRSSINIEGLLSPSTTIVSEEAPPFKKRKVPMSPNQELPPTQSVRQPLMTDPWAQIAEVGQQNPRFFVGTNPLEVDKRLALRYLNQYMDSINSNLYHIFPKSNFLSWIDSGSIVTFSDYLVLYAAMAFGTTYSDTDNPQRSEHIRIFIHNSQNILEQGLSRTFHSLVGQLILSFQAFADGNSAGSQSLLDQTLQMCYNMRINTEDGLHRQISQGMPCFGFKAEMAKECMRRVFWLAYIGNTFHNYCTDGVDKDRALTCDLRLPCDDASYDAGIIPTLPVFRCNGLQKQELSLGDGHGMIAYLVELASVLEDVNRFRHDTTLNHRQSYGLFNRKMKQRLTAWETKMKHNISSLQQKEKTAGSDKISPHGLELKGSSTGLKSNAGLSGLHVLHHFIALILHRHVAWQHLSPDQLERCVKETHKWAVMTLSLVYRLEEDGGGTMPFAKLPRTFPIASVAVLTAADVIMAAGAVSEVLEPQSEGQDPNFKEMASCAISALEDLSRYWRSATTQSKLIQDRLKRILQLKPTNTANMFYFRNPLSSPFGVEHDVVYGPSPREYFRARGLGYRVKRDSDMTDLGV